MHMTSLTRRPQTTQKYGLRSQTGGRGGGGAVTVTGWKVGETLTAALVLVDVSVVTGWQHIPGNMVLARQAFPD